MEKLPESRVMGYDLVPIQSRTSKNGYLKPEC